MSERATEVLFLPGFDGVAELRAPFVAALGAHYPARALGYPNRAMGTLNGYVRHATAAVTPQSRPVLVAESFSGLVAARWAAADPHVAGVVLCGAFARAPVPWAALGASMPSMAQFLAGYVMAPTGFVSSDPARRQWSEALGAALRSLDREVVAERLRIIATEDVSAELRALRAPVAIVQFDDDVVIGASARAHLEACCAGARVIRVAGPHFAIETRPAQSAEAIRGEIARFFA
jgi:pimeloyl-ACP methyl ester carboxylesterase